MKIIDRHIGSTVVVGTAAVMGVLLALMTFADLVNELDNVGKGSYGLAQAAEYVLLTLPRTAYGLFPSAALLGSLLGLGILSGNRELVIIRAAGVSLGRLVWSVLKAGLIMMVAAVAIGEYVAPATERLANDIRTGSLTNQVTLNSRSGLWMRDDRNFINIHTVLLGGEVGDVTIYRFDAAHHLTGTIHARSAAYRDGRWVLHDVSRSEIATTGVVSVRQARLVWPSLLNPELFDVVSVEPRDLSISGLYRYIGYLHENGLNARRYELAFWEKVMSPLAAGAMLLISIPFVMGPMRLASMGQRVLVGVLLGVGFHLLSQAISQSALVYHLNLMVFTILPTALFYAGAAFLIYRAR